MRQHLRDLVILLAVFGGLPFQVMTDSPAEAAPTPSLRLNGVQYPDGTNALGGVFNVKDPVYNPSSACKFDGTTDDTACVRAAVNAAAVKGGTVWFPTPAIYVITSQIDVSSYYPVNLMSDMHGWRDSSTSGSFITPGANFGTVSTSGNIFRYISPAGTGHASTSGSGMVRGLSFRDNFSTADTGGHYTLYAALYLYDFSEGSVRDCVFHDLNGSAIAVDMMVKGSIDNVVAIYTGSTTRPAISLEGLDGLHSVQSTSITNVRLEVEYGEYLKLGGFTTQVKVSNVGMEADTSNALTCNTMVDNQGNNNLFSNIHLNRNSATQWNDSGSRTQVTNLQILDDNTKTSNASVIVSGSENEYHSIQARGAVSATVPTVQITGTLTRFYGVDLAFTGGLQITTGSLNQIFGVSASSIEAASGSYIIDINGAANTVLAGCVVNSPPANMGGVRVTGTAQATLVSNCIVNGTSGTGISYRDENSSSGTIWVMDASRSSTTDFSATTSYTALGCSGIPGSLFNGSVATLASATTIAPTAYITHITGTTTIQTITVPSRFSLSGTGGCLRLVFDGVAPWNAAGNIAVAGTPTTAGTTVDFCFDNGTSKFYPSRTL